MKKLYSLILILFSFQFISAQSLWLQENFDYGASDNDDITVVAPDWVRHSGAQGPKYSAVGLTYPGYAGSNIGGAMWFTAGSSGVNDGDVHRKLADSINAIDTLYISFLLKLDSARTTNDYFLHLGPRTIGTTFRLRLHVKDTVSLGYKFGLAKSTETPLYSDVILNYGTTYLIVLKYYFNNTSTTDDQVQLYAYSSGVPPSEPGSPIITIGPLGNGTTGDPNDIGAIAIRQGTNTPTGKIDGIRVAKSWAYAPVPVELTSFFVNVVDGKVVLKWTTATETNNKGFNIQRKQNENFENIGFVNGNGTTLTANNYTFIDNSINAGTYVYRLQQVDFDGSINYSNEIFVDVNSPNEFNLYQNYPNPFNPSTTISFSLPLQSDIQLDIYSINGELISNILNGNYEAGFHSVVFDVSNLSSGTYIYRITAGSYTESRKMTVLK